MNNSKRWLRAMTAMLLALLLLPLWSFAFRITAKNAAGTASNLDFNHDLDLGSDLDFGFDGLAALGAGSDFNAAAALPLDDLTLDDVLNVPGGSIHFEQEGDVSFVPMEFGDRTVAYLTGSAHIVLRFTVDMAANSALYLERNTYFRWINDHTELYVNGEAVNWLEEKTHMQGWNTYAYVAEQAGEYSFELSIGIGDGSYYHLDNFEYVSDPTDASLSAALNTSDGDLRFLTYGNVDFAAVEQDGRSVAFADEFYEFYLCSAIRTLPVQLEAGDTLAFDYKVMGRAKHHYFCFYVNDQAVFFTPTLDNDEQWHSYTFTAQSAGTYSFEWMYWKTTYEEDASEPSIALDEIGINRPDAQQLVSIDEALNVPGGSIHFTSSGNQPFYTETVFGRTYAVSGARYTQYGSGTLTASVYLELNETLSFEYRSNGGLEGYGLMFYINDETYIDTPHSGLQPDNWSRLTFVAEQAGLYELRWVATHGTGRAMHIPLQLYIDNVSVESQYDHELSEALNVPDGSIRFYTVDADRFVPAEAEGRYCATTDTENKVNFSTRLMTEFIELSAGQSISFDYFFDFERYETSAGFSFEVNGMPQLSTNPNGANINQWLSFNYVVHESGTYRFTWRFYGTGVSINNSGRLLVDNVRIRAGASGDINHSGDVTVVDAILALRASMGLIELSEWEAEYGDMNVDGQITLVDAIMVLRVAIGLE